MWGWCAACSGPWGGGGVAAELKRPRDGTGPGDGDRDGGRPRQVCWAYAEPPSTAPSWARLLTYLLTDLPTHSLHVMYLPHVLTYSLAYLPQCAGPPSTAPPWDHATCPASSSRGSCSMSMASRAATTSSPAGALATLLAAAPPTTAWAWAAAELTPSQVLAITLLAKAYG